MNNASEVLLRDALDLDNTLFLQLVFFEVILRTKHVIEVVTSCSEDKTVGFNQSVINIEDDIVEFIKILALIHIGDSSVVEFFIFIFW